jgi:hypothetical protein
LGGIFSLLEWGGGEGAGGSLIFKFQIIYYKIDLVASLGQLQFYQICGEYGKCIIILTLSN